MAIAPLILAAGSAVLSHQQKSTQADIEKGQAEVAAREEELAVTQREADRKDRLASAIASQNVMAGASGIAAFEGSPLAVINDSIERESIASERDTFQSEIRSLGIRSSAKVRHQMAKVGANVGLLQSASQMYQTGA